MNTNSIFSTIFHTGTAASRRCVFYTSLKKKKNVASIFALSVNENAAQDCCSLEMSRSLDSLTALRPPARVPLPLSEKEEACEFCQVLRSVRGGGGVQESRWLKGAAQAEREGNGLSGGRCSTPPSPPPPLCSGSIGKQGRNRYLLVFFSFFFFFLPLFFFYVPLSNRLTPPPLPS